MIIHVPSNSFKMKFSQPVYKETIDSLGEFSNISYGVFGAEKDNIGRRTQVLKNLVGVRTLRQQFVNDLCEGVVVKGGEGG